MVPPPPGPSRDAATPPAAGRLSGRPPAVRPATVPGAAVRPLTATASDWPGPSGSAPSGSARIPVFVTIPWHRGAGSHTPGSRSCCSPSGILPARGRRHHGIGRDETGDCPRQAPRCRRRRSRPADIHASHQGCGRRPGHPARSWGSDTAGVAAVGMVVRLTVDRHDSTRECPPKRYSGDRAERDSRFASRSRPTTSSAAAEARGAPPDR